MKDYKREDIQRIVYLPTTYGEYWSQHTGLSPLQWPYADITHGFNSRCLLTTPKFYIDPLATQLKYEVKLINLSTDTELASHVYEIAYDTMLREDSTIETIPVILSFPDEHGIGGDARLYTKAYI